MMFTPERHLPTSGQHGPAPSGTPPPARQIIPPKKDLNFGSPNRTRVYTHIRVYAMLIYLPPKLQWRTRIFCILQRSNAQMLLSRAVHQESSCPAHAHRARASCLPDSNPYGRDGLAHSRSLSTARRALRVA